MLLTRSFSVFNHAPVFKVIYSICSSSNFPGKKYMLTKSRLYVRPHLVTSAFAVFSRTCVNFHFILMVFVTDFIDVVPFTKVLLQIMCFL